MCECHWHNPVVTYNKTAKLTALLMKRCNIPLRNVVPHNTTHDASDMEKARMEAKKKLYDKLNAILKKSCAEHE